MHRSSEGRRGPMILVSLAAIAAAACGSGEGGTGQATGAAACAGADPRITLPEGFCAYLFSDGVEGARHIDVAANGDVFVARQNQRRDGLTGGVTVLRDTDGDGRADQRENRGDNGGNGVPLAGGVLCFAPDDAALRCPLEGGARRPAGPPPAGVSARRAGPNHRA